MKIRHDYHMHTRRCGHAIGEVQDYVDKAAEVGLSEIGFSDHLPFLSHRDPKYTMDISELPDYQSDIEKVRDSSNLSIKVGIEADYMIGYTDKIKDLLKSYPYDYIIGSVHFIKQWAFDDPREKKEWDTKDVDLVYRNYYKLLQDSARTGIYDIMGHIDLVKKFGHRPKNDMLQWVEETAKVFKECGVAIEINTSGLRKPVKEIYPSQEALNVYGRYKIPIVFGSDAHDPRDVGKDFDRAKDMALKAGYKEYLVYSQRKVVDSVSLN